MNRNHTMNLRLAAAALFLGMFMSLNLQAQPVKEHGNLSVKGIQLTDEHGKATVLNGVSYGWHNWWPRFYNKDCVKWLATDWKCSVVRAALGVEPKGGYLDKPDWSKEKLEAVIQAAIENDVYVIIDWHSHSIKLAEAKLFFAEMARKYGKNPHVIYELFNEPVNDSWPKVKEYSIELIKTIRAIDPDNVILVGSPHWDQDIHLVADDPIKGFTNIMYTCHFYAATHGKFLRDRCDYAIEEGNPHLHHRIRGHAGLRQRPSQSPGVAELDRLVRRQQGQPHHLVDLRQSRDLLDAETKCCQRRKLERGRPEGIGHQDPGTAAETGGEGQVVSVARTQGGLRPPNHARNIAVGRARPTDFWAYPLVAHRSPPAGSAWRPPSACARRSST